MSRTPGRWRAAACRAALALLVLSTQALGQDFTILHHETVPGFADASSASAASGGAAKPQPRSTPSWSFVAFGRQFDVELERDGRLLHGLKLEQRERLRDVELYTGRLAGIEGSWVRLARHRGIVSGVIFDGVTLYGVETESRIARYAVTPGTGAAGVAIYRWQDTVGALRDKVVRPGSAANAPASAEASASDAERLAAMASPLPTPVGTAGAQLDIAIVADEAFVQREGASAEAAVLSIANIVHGIYVMQTGIHLNVTELVLLDAAGPFTQTDSRALLSELEEYKFSNPAFRSSGLAHLFTGRDLDETAGQSGQQVGIANLGVVCGERFGVALTQATLGTFSSALVAAHEIGHNFGAPHDGEPGECESAGSGFLMAPSVSGSRTFSQCSLEQMAAEAAGATCLTALPPADVSIAIIEAPSAQIDPEEPFDVAFEIRNDGASTAQSVEVSIAFAELDGPELVETAGGEPNLEECVQAQPAYCRFPQLEAGVTARYRLRFQALAGGPKSIDLTVSALNDQDASDNAVSVAVDVRAFVDLASEMSAQEVLAYGDEDVRLSGTVRNVGLAAASGVVAELASSFRYDIVDIDAGGGSCVRIEDGAVERFRCTLGRLAAGASRSISWTARAKLQHADDTGVEVAELHVYGAEPEQSLVQGNNTSETRITRTDAKAEVVAAIEAESSFAIGNPVRFVARISNQGPDPARDVVVGYDGGNELGGTVRSIASDVGQCTVSAASSSFDCRVGELAVAESMTITFDGTADALGTYRLSVAGSAGSSDPNTANNIATHTFSVVDAATGSSSSSSGGGGAAGIPMLLALVVAVVAHGLRGATRVAVLGATLLAVAPQHAAAQDEPGGPGAERELPEGEGKSLVQTACLSCHDLGGITAFKGYWNREQWAAMVATMIEHGAKLDAVEAEVVVDYLTAHFGVEDDHRRKRGMAE